MVPNRRPVDAPESSPMRPVATSMSNQLPATLIREHLSGGVLIASCRAPSKHMEDPAAHGILAHSLIKMAERVFPEGFIQGKRGHTAASLEEGLKQVMSTTLNEEAYRVVLLVGDPGFVPAESEDVFVAKAAGDGSQNTQPQCVFSEQWVFLLFKILTCVIASKELKAVLRQYKATKDGRAAYLHILQVLESEYYGSTGLCTCMKQLHLESMQGNQDPIEFFENMRTHWRTYDRIMWREPLSSMTVSAFAVSWLRDNPLYKIFLMLQDDIKYVDFDELERRTVHFYLDWIKGTPKEQHRQRVLSISDVGHALDDCFGVAVDHNPCPFCKDGFVYHQFFECPSLRRMISSGYPYAHSQVDPKWNPDDRESRNVVGVL